MRVLAAVVGLLVLLGLPGRAGAIGEVIVDIRVSGNNRTDESTIRSIIGIDIGDRLESDTLTRVHDRLNNSGLFADSNVYWEAWQDGVRFNVIVKEKFPWAPVPFFSRSPGNTAVGLLFAHANLFGKGKQFIIQARAATIDSSASISYRDPALFGTWLYWQVTGRIEQQTLPEFGDGNPGPTAPLRMSQLQDAGFEIALGLAWFRKVKTQLSWRLEDFAFRRTLYPYPDAPISPMNNPYGPGNPLPDASSGGVAGTFRPTLLVDLQRREGPVILGNKLTLALDMASATFGSDFDYWKAHAIFEHASRFWKRDNLRIWGGAHFGSNLPIWQESVAGGPNLRGYVSQQFRGDSHLHAHVEYHFPLVPLESWEIRGLLFAESAAVWYRDLPQPLSGEDAYQTRADGRNFLPPSQLHAGFDVFGNPLRNLHDSIGGGVRLFIRAIAVPLLGADFGYGIESGKFQFFILAGG